MKTYTRPTEVLSPEQLELKRQILASEEKQFGPYEKWAYSQKERYHESIRLALLPSIGVQG